MSEYQKALETARRWKDFTPVDGMRIDHVAMLRDLKMLAALTLRNHAIVHGEKPPA